MCTPMKMPDITIGFFGRRVGVIGLLPASRISSESFYPIVFTQSEDYLSWT